AATRRVRAPPSRRGRATAASPSRRTRTRWSRRSRFTGRLPLGGWPASPGRVCRRCWPGIAIRGCWSSAGSKGPRLGNWAEAGHVLDLGDGPGVIDWQRFGQGPLELDAGMFLATIWRLGLLDETLAGQALRAEEAFLRGIAGLVDSRALAWHRAAALVRLANNMIKPIRRQGDWLGRAHALLAEAARLSQPRRSSTMQPMPSHACAR